jgi:hypothetical protein
MSDLFDLRKTAADLIAWRASGFEATDPTDLYPGDRWDVATQPERIISLLDRIEALEAELERAKCKSGDVCRYRGTASAEFMSEHRKAELAELERVGQDARRLFMAAMDYTHAIDNSLHSAVQRNKLADAVQAYAASVLNAEAAVQNVASARRPDETEPEGASQDTPQG